MAGARGASEAIESVPAELEDRPLGNLGRPGDLVARIEEEPAKTDLLRGCSDRGCVAKLHEALDESDPLLQEIEVIVDGRQAARGVGPPLRQGGEGVGPIELRI